MKAIVYIALVLAVFAGGFWLLNRGSIDDSLGRQPDVATIFVRQSVVVPFESFHTDIGRYPTTEEGPAALLVCPAGLKERWKGPYIRAERFPPDPWSHEYRYRSPGVRNPRGYDFSSLGPDGIESDDDIVNWQK